MRPYSVQYWVYAVIAKNWGHGPKITRDSLANRFSANRHSFTVTNVNTREFFHKFKDILKDAGYRNDEGYWVKMNADGCSESTISMHCYTTYVTFYVNVYERQKKKLIIP